MANQGHSQWPPLFNIATSIIDQASAVIGRPPEWSFGGGTALMLEIDHRESHDVDLFLDDPQFLPYLNPETQGYELARQPDTYRTDGAGSLKLPFDGLGEIDFICSTNILADWCIEKPVCGRMVRMELPSEIIAKKVYHRGRSFQPRDVFDLAAVIEYYGKGYALAALREVGSQSCSDTLNAIERAKPEFVQANIEQLMLRDHTRHLIGSAQDICIRVLKEIV